MTESHIFNQVNCRLNAADSPIRREWKSTLLMNGTRSKGLPWTRSKQRRRYVFGIICASTSPRCCNGLGMKTSGLHIWRVEFRNDVLHGNARSRIYRINESNAFPPSLSFFPTRCSGSTRTNSPIRKRVDATVTLLWCLCVRTNRLCCWNSGRRKKNDEILFEKVPGK